MGILKKNVEKLEHRQLELKDTQQKLSMSAVLSELCDFKDIFIVHEILEPGRQDSRLHQHSHKEELILVLEGSPTIFIDEQRLMLNPGDFVGLRPETGKHYLKNLSEKPAKYLKICSNPVEDVVKYF